MSKARSMSLDEAMNLARSIHGGNFTPSQAGKHSATPSHAAANAATADGLAAAAEVKAKAEAKAEVKAAEAVSATTKTAPVGSDEPAAIVSAEAPPKASSAPVVASATTLSAKAAKGGLSDFAAKLLVAQAALDRSQKKYDAARADLEEKKSALLKATEDIQNSVMESTRSDRPYGTLTHSIREYIRSNPDTIITAKDVSRYTGEKDAGKIFSVLQNLMRTGEVVRESHGKYKFAKNR